MNKKQFESKYGYFTNNGREYVITRPDTPKPWVNVIANENYGLVISQAGGGFSWLDHSALSVLTRWEMDLVRDNSGKWLYITDRDDNSIWSAAPQPTMAAADEYSCTHGIGYTTISQLVNDISSEWTLTVPPSDENTGRAESNLELWRVKLHNRSNRKRNIGLCSHMMWCLGAAPDSKREFHRLFIETNWSPEKGLITAEKNLWEVRDEKYGHWNTEWPHTAWHAVWIPGKGVPENPQAVGDHALFLGRHGDYKNPAWLADNKRQTGGFGRYSDAIGAIYTDLEIQPDEQIEIMFVLGAVDDKSQIDNVLDSLKPEGTMDRILQKVKENWESHLDPVQVETPDEAFNLMNNTWLTYQAVSARLWGRTGYWQQSGAFGFRDQLQDSQVFLPHAPEYCLKQIRLHARHQFADGTVYHWWHPLSEVGLETEMTDDLLWLPFLTANYIRETGDINILNLTESFVNDKSPVSLWEHGKRSIEKVLSRFSHRGLPLIGEGDWNDGLSACGFAGKGESIWLGHFLCLVLNEWANLAKLIDQNDLSDKWNGYSQKLKTTINDIGWDGDWYMRATMDDGTPLGSKSSAEGKIFLNAQTWAVIADTADKQRAEQVMDAVEKHLLLDYGPILFTPAFSIPDRRVGYLTRYAPGTRENGGLYTHAAVWAIQAACKIGRADTAFKMFSRMAPPNRGMDPDLYTVEPYVTPGNVNGPESTWFGQGGWTWYTGSAAWLRRICLEWIIGVRPELDGLIISPCLPPEWDGIKITRPFRGDTFEITLANPNHLQPGEIQLEVDGSPHPQGVPVKTSGKKQNRKIVATVIKKSEIELEV